jgi:hypothetical protein
MTVTALISRLRRWLPAAAGLAPLILLTFGSAAPAAVIVTPTADLFPITRVGTSTTQNATAGVAYTFSGSGTTNVTFGPPLGGAPFSGGGGPVTVTVSALHPTTTVSEPYTFAPTARGLSTTTANITATNALVSPVPVGLAGLGVGPVYASTPPPGSTINFGTVQAGQSASQPLTISNTTTDVIPIILPPGDPRTRLTLEGFTITGPNAADFSFNLTPGSTIDSLGPALAQLVTFHPSGANGQETATLTIFTDQGAALGGAGASFSYLLEGFSVPEPSSLLLFGAGCAAVALCRRYRRRPGS